VFLRAGFLIFVGSTVIAAAQPAPLTPQQQAQFLEVRCDRPDEAKLTRHECYINRSGHEVHSPSHAKDGTAPAKATARCRDGTYSFSQHRQGTCSHHGGVQSWF
jgi:hypothetical protein